MRAALPVHAHAEALRGGRTLPPVDPRVRQLRGLLRREVMAPVRARSLRGECAAIVAAVEGVLGR